MNLKKRVILVTITIIGILLFRELFIYKTFQEVVSDQLNKDTTIRSMTITLYHFPEGYQERKAKITIEEKEVIDRILGDFSDMELKRNDDYKLKRGDYSISITTINKVAEDHYSAEILYLEFDEDFITISDGYNQYYKIVSETDHLKTIKSLIRNKEVEWESY